MSAHFRPIARKPLAAAIALSVALIGSAAQAHEGHAHDDRKVSAEAVVDQYANVAHATYSDALASANALRAANAALIEAPSEATLAAARTAWKQARVAYQQSEVFRFGNAIVDDWEGQLNAWPLDEGLIDYVEGDGYQAELGNPGASANIIANDSVQIGADKIDTTEITPELLASLNELGGFEANVASGYHAIEFLLWGQDMHGFEPGAGERPASDYAKGEDCTGGNCDRRGAYLLAANDLLINDLEYMVGQWAQGDKDNYRAELTSLPAGEGLEKMLFGMGSLSLGELAGERMKVALEANSFEDEHDCFSDNTHYSHFYNAKGIQNVYEGTYVTLDGRTFEGPSLHALVAQNDPELAEKMHEALDTTMGQLQVMVDTADAEDGMKFDQMIAPGNAEGAEIINASIEDLVAQTRLIEEIANDVGISGLKADTADHEF
ncbi:MULTISPECIES: imelysin family protein [Cobetia]|uniref:Imelysin family protein n=2 Tax=Gammaproteobacteria TaxID=1236 RepID=A0ABU9GJP8_COBMA|nr:MULTISPECIES: imelysin family protein [Cobetia]MDA5564472.1 imelysin family protein [Cobetia sp. MMG027]MDH2374718.1 imelysin family protein [Cobetia sp. 3AK]MDI6002494.1 imelysin family protein [Cobetia pacifica]